MRLFDLKLKNIGPFLEGEITFIGDDDDASKPPVTIITGENGTGKTIILDAIRGLMMGGAGKIERNIVRDRNNFSLILSFNDVENSKIEKLECQQLDNKSRFAVAIGILNIRQNNLLNRFYQNQAPNSTWNWVINYWTSRLSNDSFEVKGMVSPNQGNLYFNSLSGIQPNAEVGELICFFDYLKTSDSAKERAVGEKLFETIKKIVKLSLIDGEFKYVARTTLEPIVEQTGMEISLDKLSSGNLYLIQRMVALLGKMYLVHTINNSPIEELCHAPGVLLIDEAENHLHPKWQKTFIKSIQEIFPNIQIIVTTHSPFIVSSVENARIYVCKSEGSYATITDETAEYSNKPIEEILLSQLFAETSPFNQDISEMMSKRKAAIQANNMVARAEIEQQLLNINPQYFSYFEIDSLLDKLTQKQ